QRKCLDKIGEVATKGLGILLVSHDLAAVRSRCDVAHLFDGGQVVASGTPQEIVDTYVARVVSEGPKVIAARSWRLNGTDVHTLEAGSPCTVDIDVDVAAAIADATVTLQIGRDAIALWVGSVRADLEPRAYRVEFE